METRMILENEAPYDIIEQDATAVIAAALHMVAKNAV